MIGQIAENLDSLGGLSSALVNHSRLILGHGDEFLVFAGTDLLQLLESLIVPFEIFVAKRGVISGKSAGICVRIFFGDGGELLNGVFRAGGFGGIERLARVVGIGYGADAGGVGLVSNVERRGSLHGLAIGVKAPAKIADSNDHDS